MKDIELRLLKLKEENLKKYELIKKIINSDNWFLKLDIDTFVNILNELGYDKEEALNIYKKLIVGMGD